MEVTSETFLRSSDGESAREILIECKLGEHRRQLRVSEETNRRLELESRERIKMANEESYVHKYVRLHNLNKRKKNSFGFIFGIRRHSSDNKIESAATSSKKVSKKVRFNNSCENTVGYEDTPALIWMRPVPQTSTRQSNRRFKEIKAIISKIF